MINNKKSIGKMIVGLLVVFMLSGCMYPQEKRAENQVSNNEQLAVVQQAVDQYREDTGVLPIQTKEEDTPIYQKYVVDFRELIPRYLQEPPSNSFENGGAYQYVIIDPETTAHIKVIDLRMMNEIQQAQMEINRYIQKNGYSPVKEPIGKGLFRIDQERLNGNSELKVPSPYHHDTYLPLIMNANGQVLVDYSIDLNIALEEFDHSFKEGEDIRSILTDHYPIAPAFSVPYTIDESGEPVIKE